MKPQYFSRRLARDTGIVLGLTVLLGPSMALAAPRDRQAPTRPTNLRVTAVHSYGVTLAWNASSDNSGNFSYRVVSSAGYSATVPQTQTTSTFLAHHTPGGTHSFYMFAVDAAGNTSKNSNTVTATLLADTTPPTAPVLSVADLGPTHISLAWTTPVEEGPVVRYWLYRDGIAIVIGGQTTSFTLWFLNPGTTHTFTVRARDGAGLWSAHSNAVTVTTPQANPNDTTPPTTPTNPLEDHYSCDAEMSLWWTQSTDDLDPQSVIEYHIYVNGELSDLMVGSGGRSINYLTAQVNTVSVIAVDTAGNESAPATITVYLCF